MLDLVWHAHNNCRDDFGIGMGIAAHFGLPAITPDLNPIEMVFAKIKALIRSAAARCADTLCIAIASALSAFTPQEFERYLRHAGYAST